MQAEVADAIVFDMDGVLINVHSSYPVVITKAVDAFLQEEGFTGDAQAVTTDETAFFKAAGGFNSDWHLAQGICLVYLVKGAMADTRNIEGLRQLPPDLATIARSVGQFGGGLPTLIRVLRNLVDPVEMDGLMKRWDCDRITRLAQEFYAGDDSLRVFGVANETVTGAGLMMQERAMVTRDKLTALPFRYGLYTGRNRGEVDIAIQMAGLSDIFSDEAMITEDLGIQKPNPEGLFLIARVLKPRLMLYVGDNLDDWQTAARYEAERSLDDPPCLFAGMLGGSPGPLAYSLFQERGVDLMASSVTQLLTWIAGRRLNT